MNIKVIKPAVNLVQVALEPLDPGVPDGCKTWLLAPHVSCFSVKFVYFEVIKPVVNLVVLEPLDLGVLTAQLSLAFPPSLPNGNNAGQSMSQIMHFLKVKAREISSMITKLIYMIGQYNKQVKTSCPFQVSSYLLFISLYRSPTVPYWRSLVFSGPLISQ
jgi:hypothetical protein